MTEVILRENYLNKIRGFIGKPVIKVITGIQGAGKSYFLKQVIDSIKKNGVPENDILYINKELLKFDFIEDYKDLYSFIEEHFKGNNNFKYLIIDEIQEITEWEKAISSFFAEGEYDIYLTGSNSHLLSSELSTLISGRYVEINIYTLSFKEFLKFRKTGKPNLSDEFKLYLRFGGFPVIHNFELNEEVTYQYINSIYNTIILKDVIARHNIRNVRLFQDIVRFAIDNLGQIFSSNSINKYLKNQKKNVGPDTIQNYLGFLESSFLLHKVRRYDLRGKKILNVFEKYYLGDISIKNALLGYSDESITGLLENIVFLKLKQDGYDVYIGKLNDLEVDFIAEKQGKRKYIQVTYLLESEQTITREYGVLEKIKDNYPKYIISMDNLPPSDKNGIIRLNIIDFLMD
ncbi:MAG: ATP-binding protein [Chlorobi bacterium]|nr:ATP-binding protein [Chlorobiota bacterium]